VVLAGRTALVTGAARGIGRATAARLAREGARVLVVDRDRREAEEAAAEIRADGGEASPLVADLTRRADVRRAVQAGAQAAGGLGVLVNNAGGYDEPVYPEAPSAHWEHTLDLNLRAVMLAIQEALPALEASGGGAVVNVASSAGLGLSPHPGPEYATAKAGVIRLTACLAPLAERGIRVNCVCPHTVGTRAVRRTIAELRAAGEDLPPALEGELLEPEEVAELIMELVTDERLAGRVLVCRGGEPPRLLPVDVAW
jgi:NAD(P)-dependent dehydrogenase (short-subunit alcohol dehydrogenase family)